MKTLILWKITLTILNNLAVRADTVSSNDLSLATAQSIGAAATAGRYEILA
jgi:hypothetical protein